MEGREIRIKNRQGKKLFCRVDGIISERRSPAVLIVHGFKGDSAQRHITGISDSLVSLGFLTLRVDLTKNPGRSYLNFPEVTYAQELADFEDVFEYLLQMPNVDRTRIGIAGHSLGGMLTAELASKRKEVKSLAILSGVYDFRSMMQKVFKKSYDSFKKDFEERGFTYVWSSVLNKDLKVKKAFYEDIAFRTADNFAKNMSCPTLVVSAENDESVSQSHADKYLNNITSKVKKMEIIKGSDHNYSGQALDKVTKVIADWFEETIK